MVRTEGRFAPGFQPEVTTADPLLLRLLRLTLSGRLAKYVEYRVSPTIASHQFDFSNAWIEVRISDAFRVRVGKDKTPVGLEALQPDPTVWFLERGLPTGLLPGYDIGAQAIGQLHHGALTYATGVFKGIADGSHSHSRVNGQLTGRSPDLVGRIVFQPFSGNARAPLAGLGVGVAGSRGRQEGAALPSFKTSIQQSYFTYGSGAVADGARTRVTPQVFYYYGTVGILSEYARSAQEVSNGATHATIANQAWQVAGFVTVTGENGSRVHPAHTFDPVRGQWGAVQLTARHGVLTIDRGAFTLGFADPSAARQVRATTLGAIWYLTEKAKGLLNYEHVGFSGGTPRRSQNTILFRLQVSY